MSDLTAFLLARIAEDQALARKSAERDGAEAWHWVSGEEWHPVTGEQYEGAISADLVSEATFISPGTGFDLPVRQTTGGPVEIRWPAAEHIARHDPARVLAECDAKRSIVERVSDVAWGGYAVRDEILALLALPYSDHADFRDKWRP